MRVDDFGYTWIIRRRADADLAALLTDLHAVNSTLVDAGFGSSLLCTLFGRGTFYPFAPTGDRSRDTTLEMMTRGRLTGDLPVEPDLSRWFPIWGAPAW